MSIIAALLVDKGMTQAELADRAGLHPITVGNLMHKTGNMKSLSSVAEALGYTLPGLLWLQQAYEDSSNESRTFK
jgi:transcriptional regulator with XRE-family HTH domain